MLTKYFGRLCRIPLSRKSLFKVTLASCLITIVLSLQFLPDLISTTASASQYYDRDLAEKLVLKGKMVAFMKSTNPEIDPIAASALADAIIKQHEKTGIPVNIQLGMAASESSFRQYVRGKAGEIGYYQIYTKMHVDRIQHMLASRAITNPDIFDAHTNAAVAADILSECLRKKNYNYELALTCYNGGSTPGVYVKKVMKAAKKATTKIT